MIQSKEDLQRYLSMDKRAPYRKTGRPHILSDPIWAFEVLLRKSEYYTNTCGKNPIKRFLKVWYRFAKGWLGIILGFSIPINTCGGGLRIMHHGTIVINSNARLGEWCSIMVCVNIGQLFDNSKETPKIGNKVWIGPGAKIYGDITIADEIVIGANSVVNKSFNESNIVIAGAPAKKIKDMRYPYDQEIIL
jgi:serine O-acetyltransferase